MLFGMKLSYSQSKLLGQETSKLALKYSQEEYSRRKKSVRGLIYEEIPLNLAEKFDGNLIIEDGKYNLLLAENEPVQLDYYIPELRLFILVGDVRSSTWAEASAAGIDRAQWENYAELILQLARIIQDLNGKFVILNWNDPLTPEYFSKKLNVVLQ
jgi:hypothetical protein